MSIYNDNSNKSLFWDSNFTNDNLANLDEDENEIMYYIISTSFSK